ncbi:DUF6250 domain-containing protein [Sphingopyxis sp.]|uniref:DUF6250 domain-containing protein n=1 Tax=Sphingopyxis sp. TaxID=1908224 RepID=UPI002B46AED7|nr:DUF6250 domain-containing protein [Sphingopyxis sp.]HJS11857.1 DUF6250 domain-containing protein [Sphingopyxis sp.]
MILPSHLLTRAPLWRSGGFLLAALLAGCAGGSASSAWQIEAEDSAARVSFAGGIIDIDTAKGLSLWYRAPLQGPVAISFEAMAVSEGGPNDAVSDLNAFWMATNADGSAVFSIPRSGAFAEYDDLKTYYVGVGGNRNSTTRFRRYVGKAGNRPLLPQHDRSDPAVLLQPNRWTHIRLIADGARIAVERDGAPLFTLEDPEPYRRGHFAIRTTKSHLRVAHFRISRP